MSILSTIKKILGFSDELQTAFSVAALLVQKIEDSSLPGPEKLAWVREQLELYLPKVAPKIAAKFFTYWPKINAYIDALVLVANMAGVFRK